MLLRAKTNCQTAHVVVIVRPNRTWKQWRKILLFERRSNMYRQDNRQALITPSLSVFKCIVKDGSWCYFDSETGDWERGGASNSSFIDIRSLRVSKLIIFYVFNLNNFGMCYLRAIYLKQVFFYGYKDLLVIRKFYSINQLVATQRRKVRF